MTKNETKRKTTWMTQRGKCAICLEHQETVAGMCFVPEQDALICRACSAFLSSYKERAGRGVTPEMLAAFLTPLPEPEDSGRMFISGEWCEVVDEEWVVMNPQPERVIK